MIFFIAADAYYRNFTILNIKCTLNILILFCRYHYYFYNLFIIPFSVKGILYMK